MTSVLLANSLALPAILDGKHLVESFGVAGLLAIVFAETGLLLGFFLPGDSLLFFAGVAAAGGVAGVHPNIALLCALVAVVAVLGAQTGYFIGSSVGPALFDREDSRLFKKSYVTKAEATIERYGAGKAIVLARFIPIVRTFLNPLVGAGELPLRVFALWNVIGGVLWGVGVTLLGYFLGNVGHGFIGRNIEFVAIFIVILSVLPIALELRKSRQRP